MISRLIRPLAAVALLTLTAVGPAAAQGELRVAIPWTPENLDPTMNLASIRSQVGVSLFDSLVGRDADGKIVGELAESWRALDDRTWQFRLRREKAGFRPKVQVAEWGAYFKKMQDAYLLGLGGPMQDADELCNLVSSKGRGLYYKNERVDELFDQGRGTTDPARRRKMYADLARAMVEDATWMFLMQQVDIYATRDRLTWTARPDQWLHFHAASLK
jgi:ABC-type transport system substrate-binding protein